MIGKIHFILYLIKNSQKRLQTIKRIFGYITLLNKTKFHKTVI